MDQTVPAPRRRSPRLIAALAIAIVLVGAAVAAAVYILWPRNAIVAVATPTNSPSPSPSATPSPSPTPSPTPSLGPSQSPLPAGPDPLLGTDGRLTILLLGSDARRGLGGSRTDVIMVVSLDPTTGAVAAAGIPRDAANFPVSSRATYSAKVNGLYQSLISRIGQTKAAREMKGIVGAGIGVEIDSYAVIGFEGVRQLVNSVGGVDVLLAKSVSDPSYWVTPRSRGIFFPAGRNHLSGDRALIFARTRKGDNDFERARRQQLLVAAAVDAVRHRGLANLPKLIAIAQHYIKTDLPLGKAPQLFEIISKARVGELTGVVFGPTKWATGSSGTSFTLRLKEVRAWTAQWMGRVTAPPVPLPSPAPTPFPGDP